MTMPSHLRFGTRGSKLALRQTALATEAFRAAHPSISVEIVRIKTQGDTRQNRPLSEVGGSGFFTKELEQALLSNTIDVAVHSLKDLPAQLARGLCLSAVLKRENPLDVLVSEKKTRLLDLPAGAKIGTSSLRRTALLHIVRPDIIVVPVRGNIETRIRTMRTQGIDALILAYAGLARLGIDHLIAEIIPPHLMLPAPGQGAIALEARATDTTTLSWLKKINHARTFSEISAERAFLESLDAGCQVPLGCLAQRQGDKLFVQGCIATPDGSRICTATVSGMAYNAALLGSELAARLRTQGCAEILAAWRGKTGR